ncbi:aminoglycoside phosphotransferase family protein [Litorisediminicola beolgyonensis]|uniref:Aminoglycoside phosphotransferase family protein n=1 Tax=Litorisediminicola beolgyonensis TaxID=1173614 RepID=A0ABW3ZNY2_9RHOB
MAGDASARRYTRLARGDARAILMQDPEGDVALFARLARHLSGLGLSAPRILAEDSAGGELLIEDLGDALLARLCADTPGREPALYEVAVDVLLSLHRAPPPAELPRATPARLAAMTDLAFTAYVAPLGADVSRAQSEVEAAFAELLTTHADDQGVMVLRDYHAENLLWLPEREGAARMGLLDFQDALAGPKGYDLVSLVEDARRDVSEDARAAAIRRYCTGAGRSAETVDRELALLGAQRNLRILGVFARLAREREKPGYLALMPRVWAHLERDLAHPVMSPVRKLLEPVLPEPTPARLARLGAA